MVVTAAELRRRGVTWLVLVDSSMAGTAITAQITPPVPGVVSF
jgi:hypothetical protein